MPSVCFAPFRVPAVRVTKLDSCGAVDTATCSSVSSTGIITVEQTAELNERQDFFTLNGDGNACFTETSPPILKWINVTLTFCNVDPEMFTLMTGEPLVLDDSATPQAVGFRTREGSITASNFGFESWARLGGSSNCSGGTLQYGYFLLPWLIEGSVGDLTFQNGLTNFTITARTRNASLWGTGPYAVRRIMSGTGVGNPRELLTAISATDHRHIQVTTLPPPTGACGCVDATPTVAVAPTSGASPLAVVLTVPAGTLPAAIDWGDGTAEQVVTSGATVNHSYTAPGTYVAVYRSNLVSGPVYRSATITVS